MNPVLRAAAIYFFLLIVFRISGKRSLAETNTFDLVLIMVVAEATQQALLGEDFSMTNAYIVIATLIVIDLLLNWIRQKSSRFDRITDGVPLVIVKDGKLLHDRARRLKVEEDDVLEAARLQQGLARMDQIRYAVLERGGEISVIGYERS